MNPNLTEDENFVMSQWSMWGSSSYPIVKRGRHWFVDGIRGLGQFPTVFKTKREAVKMWEQYISVLIDRGAGRLPRSS